VSRKAAVWAGARRALTTALLALALCACFGGAALALDAPKNAGEWVTDTARLLSPADKNALGAQLRAYAGTSGNQIVVLTIPSLEGEDAAGFANKVARAWGVGQKDKNNGVLILVARREGKVRFEVGRGIEDRLTDVACKRIQREITVPHFKAGRFAQGLSETVAAMQGLLSPPAEAQAQGVQPAPAMPAPANPVDEPPLWFTLGLLGLVVLLGLWLLRRRYGSGRDQGFGHDSGFDSGFGPGGGQGVGNGSSFLMGLLLGILSSFGRGGRGGPGGFGGGSGGDGGFSGGGGDFGGGGSDSDFGGGGDDS